MRAISRQAVCSERVRQAAGVRVWLALGRIRRGLSQHSTCAHLKSWPEARRQRPQRPRGRLLAGLPRAARPPCAGHAALLDYHALQRHGGRQCDGAARQHPPLADLVEVALVPRGSRRQVLLACRERYVGSYLEALVNLAHICHNSQGVAKRLPTSLTGNGVTRRPNHAAYNLSLQQMLGSRVLGPCRTGV
jgi:hypothetical protein